MISLRGLPRLVVAEILYGLQRRCAEGVLTHRAVLRPLCDDLRRLQAGSITKRWAAEDLPQRRGRNAPNILQYVLGSLAELDASLRLQRDDHGADPALLGRRDIVAFTNRLAFLQQDGALSLNRRIDVLRHASTVITWSRPAALAAGTTLIDDTTWATMIRQAGMRLVPAGIGRRYLYELLTGCGLATAPPPYQLTSAGSQGRYNDFVLGMPPA